MFVLSLSQTNIGPISASGDLTFGNTANGSVTLSIPQVTLPPPPGTNAPVAPAYEWTIPAGWRFPDGTVSNGSPRLINSTSANSIMVTPTAAGTSFSATVRAADNQCAGSGIVSSRSQPVSGSFNRILPTLRIASNGAPTTITCGDRRDFQFRAETSGGQPGGSFTYSWAVTNNWALPNATTQVPGIVPNGTSGTIITLGGSYSRNGATAQLAATPLTINYSPNSATPQLPATASFCVGETRQISFEAVPGATQYQWQLPAGFTSATATTSVPVLTVTAPSTGGTYNGPLPLTVSAGSAGCGSSSATLGVILGTGYVYFTGDYGTVSGEEVCANSTISVSALQYEDRGSSSSYSWSTSAGQLLGAQGAAGMSIQTPGPGQTMDIAVQFLNDCGGVKIGHFFLRTVERFADGSYCQGVILPRPARPAAAYPNPAEDELTVTITGATLTLYNAHGQPVLRQAAAGRKTVRLNTHDLPAGIYYLDQGDGQRQRIRIGQ